MRHGQLCIGTPASFEISYVSKRSDDVVKDPFNNDGRCGDRRPDDILWMEFVNDYGTPLDEIAVVGNNWFAEDVLIGRHFSFSAIHAYLSEKRLAVDFNGVVRCAIITTPKGKANAKALKYLSNKFANGW